MCLITAIFVSFVLFATVYVFFLIGICVITLAAIAPILVRLLNASVVFTKKKKNNPARERTYKRMMYNFELWTSTILFIAKAYEGNSEYNGREELINK